MEKLQKRWKKLWSMIDWKGKVEVKIEEPAEESEILRYFRDIFQSKKTENHPKINSIICDIDSYDMHIPILDRVPSMEELDVAIKRIGSGISLDGIPPQAVHILPPSMKELIVILMQKVFFGEYPNEWTKQVLNSIKKDGHTPEDPKLRGIAIGPLLCRLYDIIIDERFKSWYTPNYEQAGCRDLQGCPFQLFMMIILIHYARENGIDLYVGFMDYEKAYDYANRANIISDLMKDGCSSAMVRALTKMLTTSTYCPKSSKNCVSEGIETDYGVTQGRCSSGNIFSYYVSKMSSAFDPEKTDDFMDPYNLAQLADDTALYATSNPNLKYKFSAILTYSDERYQIPNIPKTKYCHFSENPDTEPLIIDQDTVIKSVDDKGYKYTLQTILILSC